ncbi:hypothetical protein Q8A73_001031 [Channa argus]|nr:hypothetical protein Q8A73_001031 [Channa argus]
MTCDVIEVTTRVRKQEERGLYETKGRIGDKEEGGDEEDDEGRTATLTSPQGSGEEHLSGWILHFTLMDSEILTTGEKQDEEEEEVVTSSWIRDPCGRGNT